MKIAIIGGGPAGCGTSFYLKDYNCDVTIFEQHLLGGACRTEFYESIPFEFGPQILYTELDDIKQDFEIFVSAVRPPSEDGEYHPKVSIDGLLNDCHDFPLTLQNVLRHPETNKIINELYHVNLSNPDYSSLEGYLVSRVGRTLYETYMMNYNIKQWKIHPRDLDAQWATTRTLTLRERPDMFQGKWQGHPGDYNPLWEGLSANATIVKRSVDAVSSQDGFIHDYMVDGSSILSEYDAVISTLSPHKRLPSINFCIIYVSLRCETFLMPSYATSFPNNYSFVRIMEYKQQYYVDSEYTLLDFEFPWTEESGGYMIDSWINEVREFCSKIFLQQPLELFVRDSYRTYPLITSESLKLLDNTFERLSHTNIIPVGRAGIHSYISKDTCLYMGKTIASHILSFPNYSPPEKLNLYRQIRSRLS